MKIASRENARFKAFKALLDRRGRAKADKFLVEGRRIIERLFDSAHRPETAIYCEGMADEESACLERLQGANPQLEMLELSRELFKELSRAETPQRLMVCAGRAEAAGSAGEALSAPLSLAAENLQDPRNLGALLRLCDALGLSGLLAIGACPDPLHPVCIQASAGSALTMEVWTVSDAKTFLAAAKSAGARTFAADGNAGKPFTEFDPAGIQKIALILGNEGNGLTDELLKNADERVSVPIFGKAESLNVAASAAVLGYYFRCVGRRA